MLAPSLFNFFIPSKILFLDWGSTATVGSSKIIKSGLWAIPQAIFNLLKSPPDNCLGLNLTKSPRPTRSIVFLTRIFLLFLFFILY